MVRNNEPWILGEPELNSRGQPVVHDIATRLGCIRPSTDLSDALVEDIKSYTQFQTKFETRCVEMGTGHSGNRRASASSLSPAYTDRASSAESGYSLVDENYKQTLWVQEQQEQPPIDVKVNCSISSQTTGQATPSTGQRDPEYESSYGSSLSEEDHFNSKKSATFPYPSPFTPLSIDSDFLGQDGPIDLTSQFIWALQCETQINRSFVLPSDLGPNIFNAMDDRTLIPRMLDPNGYGTSCLTDRLVSENDNGSQMEQG